MGTGVLYWSRLFGRILKSFLSRLLEARFMGMGAGVRWRSPLLDEGIRGPVRFARLGIGMIYNYNYPRITQDSVRAQPPFSAFVSAAVRATRSSDLCRSPHRRSGCCTRRRNRGWRNLSSCKRRSTSCERWDLSGIDGKKYHFLQVQNKELLS